MPSSVDNAAVVIDAKHDRPSQVAAAYRPRRELLRRLHSDQRARGKTPRRTTLSEFRLEEKTMIENAAHAFDNGKTEAKARRVAVVIEALELLENHVALI